MKVWERRLMKDFHVATQVACSVDLEDDVRLEPPIEGEDNVAKWKRIAKLAVQKSPDNRWTQVRRSERKGIVWFLLLYE